MALIEWKDSYSVGIDAVDHEHRELIGLINRFHESLLATVLVLWDKKHKTIVKSRSAEIVRMFEAGTLADQSVDVYLSRRRADRSIARHDGENVR